MSGYGERDLDVKVAEAMGWGWRCVPLVGSSGPRYARAIFGPDEPTNYDRWDGVADLPLSSAWDCELARYSASPAAYMGLLEEQRKAGRAWELQVLSESALDRYGCKVWAPSGKAFCAIGLSPGEAVCRAVLAALEGGAK